MQEWGFLFCAYFVMIYDNEVQLYLVDDYITKIMSHKRSKNKDFDWTGVQLGLNFLRIERGVHFCLEIKEK